MQILSVSHARLSSSSFIVHRSPDDERTTMTRIRDVDLVPLGLHPTETRKRCADLLSQLDALALEITTNIDARVVEHGRRSAGLRRRIEALREAVRETSTSRRARTVTHAGRYPEGEVGRHRMNLHAAPTPRRADEEEDGTVSPMRRMTIEEMAVIRRQRIRGDGTAEMYWKSAAEALHGGGGKSGRDGLGRLPARIESLNECLLFNSDVNPYVEYAVGDNLMRHGKGEGDARGGGYGTDEERDAENEYEDDWKNLADAPKSITNAYDSMHGTQFGFRPTMEEMPEVSFPTSLPSLRYAADISWSGAQTEASSIAPSSTATPLPDVIVAAPAVKPGVPAPMPPGAHRAPMPPPPPPPPPLPPGAAPSGDPPAQLPRGANVGDAGRSALMEAIRNKDNRSRLRKRGGNDTDGMAPSKPPIASSAAEPDLRGALMDAIRSKPALKSTSSRSAAPADPTTTAHAAPAAAPRQLSMMEELANSLGRRRSAMVASGDHDVREKITRSTGASGGIAGFDDFVKSRAGGGDDDDDDHHVSDLSDWDDD